MLESESWFHCWEHTTDAASFCLTTARFSWNKAAEGLLGYLSKEVLRKTCYEVPNGTGPLGTQVCHDGCMVMDCAGMQAEIPNFDMSVATWGRLSGFGLICQRSFLITSGLTSGC